MPDIKNVISAARLKCCGLEDRTVVAHDCRKTVKIICGMEGEMLWLMAACLHTLPRLIKVESVL